MMKWTFVLVVCVALGSGSPAQARGGEDLEAYIEGIRASGISEMGLVQLRSIAAICAGSTILEYRVDEASGQYWPSYRSTTCPRPETDTAGITEWKELRMTESQKLAGELKQFADADGSGFVTTAEASEFRRLVEFGYLVDQVIRDEGASLDLVARASGKSDEDAARDIDEYRKLARRINESGLTTLPELIVADAGAPFQ